MRSELEAVRVHLSESEQTRSLLDPDDKEAVLGEIKKRIQAEAGADILKSIEARIISDQTLKNLSDEIQEPFEEVQLRLIAEIDSLGRRANLNLALGGLTTLVGLGFLGFFIIYAPQDDAKLTQIEDLIHFAVHFIPRITLVLFIEVFAYFFLRLYKANLADIKFFQNELTNIESKYLGLRTALRINDPAIISDVVSKLSSTERNLGMIKDQTAADIERAKIEKEGLAEIFQNISNIFSKRSS
ncbi:MAG: hypothetical protein ACK4Z4_10685 [Ferrovibrio sp.]